MAYEICSCVMCDRQCIHICIYTHMYTYVHIHAYVHIRTYVQMYIVVPSPGLQCIFLYIMLLSPGLYQACGVFFDTGQNQQSSIVWTTPPVIQ